MPHTTATTPSCCVVQASVHQRETQSAGRCAYDVIPMHETSLLNSFPGCQVQCSWCFVCGLSEAALKRSPPYL